MKLILYILPTLLGSIWKKSKAFDVFAIVCLCIIYVTSTNQADYSVYKNTYDGLVGYGSYGEGLEPGWQFLYALGNFFSLPYLPFSTIVFLIALILYAKCFADYSSESSFCWTLLMLFPLLIGFSQIRQLVAIPIILYSLRYLREQKTSDYFRYIIGILLASCLHSTSIFFLVLLAIPLLNYSWKAFAAIAAISLGLVIALPEFVQNIASILFSDSKVAFYFSGRGGSTSFVAQLSAIVFVVVGFILSFWAYKRIASFDDSRASQQYWLARLNLGLQFIFVAILPILVLNTDFMRLHRLAAILIYVVVSNVVFHDRHLVKGLIERISLIGFAAALGLAYIIVPAYPTVVMPLLMS